MISSSKTKICLVIGDPIEHSLSPLMHNAGYRALGIDDQFVFLAARVKLKDVKYAVKAVKVMGFRGLTCTMPHKLEVLKYLDKIDKTAREIGAVNTVVNDDGILKGYNTDWLGALKPLAKITKIKGKKIGIIGAGGAARATIYGLKKKRGSIKIFNKNIRQAKWLAKKFNCEFGGFDELNELKHFDIIINATPLGMKPYENISPVPKEIFSRNQIVMDAVYIPYKTKILREAEKMGAKTIPGIEMFLEQGAAQFFYYTKRKAPIVAMRKALLDYLKSII
ncbi:shikimate dehydrogenase [Patescibacteria group bacterium]|nr:shikimate dehydrogenase [Patescibacteria group bacterium]MBU4481108.1 shikimate dehydrogenase [Patescibacteria group bacterium]